MNKVVEKTLFTPSTDLTKQWFWVIAVAWTVIVSGSLFWNRYEHNEEISHFVGAEANAMIEDIIVARLWNAEHGGVYVKLSDADTPNPYLKGLVKERDIVTASGTKLTLINPAYMTRQLNELLAERLGRTAHITSLKPIRPENAADAWEAKALKLFEQGATEFQELTEIDGEPYMRLMRPLITEKACLQCHAQQGYKEDDIRGGISASIPMQKHLAVFSRHQLNNLMMHGLMWILGFAGLCYGRKRLNEGLVKNKQAEEALKNSEESLKRAQEVAHLGNWSWDILTNKASWSDQTFHIFGLKPGEIEPSYEIFNNLVHPEDREMMTASIEKTLKERLPYDVEYRVIRADGSERRIHAQGQLLLDDNNNPKALFGINHDITEQKQAAEMLHKLSQAIEQAGEGIEITDKDGIIEYVNPAFEAVTGYSESELIGQNPRILKSGKQDAEFYERMWARLTSGKVWQGRVIDKKKDGTLYPAMLTISPITNDQGEITNYVGIQKSLQEYEELEEQFHQSQKMEAIGTLVGGIAHDFNNTLAGITANLYLAKLGIRDNPDITEKLESVERLSFRAADMIQQLLSFSRKGIVQKHPMSVSSFLKEVIKLHRVSIPENIDLSCEVMENSMVINADVNQLQQILMNLINNARDAVAAVHDPKIQVSLCRSVLSKSLLDKYPEASHEEYACIAVRDNGCGLDADIMEHIFEPFFTTKEVGQGSGLGLSMAYGAVQTHHGFIDVCSDGLGAGAEFKLYFPLLDSGALIDSSSPVESQVKGHGECILLVDDDETVLSSGKEVLESMNYRVLIASDGKMALDLYRERRGDIDLLIFDIVMPKMGGVEALSEIRNISPDVKVIFSTGYDKLSRLKSREVDLSLEVVLKKPFAISELGVAIRQKLDH